MSLEGVAVQAVLARLKGKPAWGLVRTYGSMFFLEVGEPLPRVGDKKVHGEWHFLVEMSHWRIDTAESVLVGSDDEQELIDHSFAHIELGSIELADAASPSHDLDIVFTSGMRLRTFSASATVKEQAQWKLFVPEDEVWIVDGSGGLAHKNAYA
jgi:hypothetical protein